jgi:hypothetical protein
MECFSDDYDKYKECAELFNELRKELKCSEPETKEAITIHPPMR